MVGWMVGRLGGWVDGWRGDWVAGRIGGRMEGWTGGWKGRFFAVADVQPVCLHGMPQTAFNLGYFFVLLISTL